MTDEGGRWISVPVEMLQPGHPLHPRDQGEEACRLAAWLDLVGKAHWKAGNGFERGELEASVRFLADRWGWGRSRVQRFLDELEEQGEIVRETQTGRKPGRIKVCDYGRFAGPRDTNRDANRDSGDGVRRERVQKTGQSAGRSSAGGEGLLSEDRDVPRDAERDASEDKAVPVPREETDTEGEDSSLRSSSSPPQSGTDDKSDYQDDGPLDLTELDSVSGEDLVAWVRGTPASESAPTAYWVDGVRELWWGQDEDPVGHGVGATMRYLTTERESHSDSYMDGSRFIVGCYLLRERGELMGLDPGEPFGRGLLLRHDDESGRRIWYRSLEAAEELERQVEDPGEALRDLDVDLGGILGEEVGDGR